MTESTARIALRKARYFLSQAQAAESDPNTLDDRLPFAANLEAAIVYSRTAIEHLKAEYSSKFNEQGYRRWHDQKWKQSSPLFHYFFDRRNFILHQEPESTHAQVNTEIAMEVTASVSVSMTVTRADGRVEHIPPETAKPRTPPTPPSVRRSQQYFFNDDDWRGKPALGYVEEFLECCENFVAAAEGRFG